MTKTIRVGTRKSLLARIQTQIFADKVREIFPDVSIEIVPISTKGDERLEKALSSFGGKGVFTKELEEKLLGGEIDLAVHSAKDMPVALPEGLAIGAVLKREYTEDVFVLRAGEYHGEQTDIAALPEGFVVGTGSLRRELQIRALNPGLRIKPIRGNVQTRLSKLAAGEYDGIILARAGLERLFLFQKRFSETAGAKTKILQENQAFSGDSFDYGRFCYIPLSLEQMLPAAAQGILAVEARKGEMTDILKAVSSDEALEELCAERAFLQTIGGSCNAPAAALSVKANGELTMQALYCPDGKTVRCCQGKCPAGEGEALGRRLAGILLEAPENGQPQDGGLEAPPENGGPQDRALEASPGNGGQPGKVWLIGAGPGDPGLVSVKGISCLRQADVVIYDHLAASGLLNEVRDDAKLIYAGKQAGSHYLRQEETNQLLVKYAREGKNVARLKGGDVFIFGRGGEEGMALFNAGIDFEVIPGISSAYAVPAYQGIPVTHRGVASSFHVITGHEDAAKGAPALDYGTLAREEGTLVFLMGLKNLPAICEKLIAHGKDKKTPAAVLSQGTTARQAMVTGPLDSIAKIAENEGIKTPAITVVGDVTRLHEALSWYDRRPLSGKRVLLTATKPMAAAMADKLMGLGAEPVAFSLIQTKPVADGAVEEAYRTLEDYTWLVFTSRNGVDVFFEGLRRRRIDMRRLSRQKFAAIGDGTAKALEAYGIYCDYIPKEYTSAAMAKDWVPALGSGDKVLLLRARQASPVLLEGLKAHGIAFNAVALYETKEDWRKAPELLRILPEVDYVTLCSASAAAAFYKMINSGESLENLKHHENTCGSKDTYSYGNAAEKMPELPKLICIGPVTARAAKSLGLEVCKTADVYNIDGLIECMV